MLFTVGNAAVKFPLSCGRCLTLAEFVTVLLMGLIYTFPIAYISQNASNAFLKKLTAVLTVLYCTLCLTACCGDYIQYVDTSRLPNSSAIFIAVTFILTATIIALSPTSVLYRFAAFSFIVVAVGLALILLLSTKNIHLRYLGIGGTRLDFSAFSLDCFAQSFIAVTLCDFKSRKTALKLSFSAFGIAAALFAVIYFVTVGSLGVLVGEVSYPFPQAASFAAFGGGYNRLDGVSYAIYFLCAALKADTALAVIKKRCGVFGKRVQAVVPVLAAVQALLCVNRTIITALNGVLPIVTLATVAVFVIISFIDENTKSWD